MFSTDAGWHPARPSEAPGLDPARLAGLHELTAALSRAATMDDVGLAAITAAVRHLRADGVLACLLDESQSRWEVARHVGLEPQTSEAWLALPLDGSTPVGEALRRRRPVVLETRQERHRRFPALAATHEPYAMHMATPMTADDGKVEGMLMVAYRHGLGIDAATRATAAAIAERCGRTAGRTRLYDFHRRAHVNQRFIAQVGQLLAGPLEHDEVLARVVRLAVPTLADACVLFLLREGRYEPAAAAHAEPERDVLLQRLVQDLRVADHPFLDQVATTGHPLLLAAVPDEALREVAGGDEHLRSLRSYGARSMLAVGLAARERTLGVLVLAVTSPHRTLEGRDLPIVGDLAARAGLAIDNARVHTERRVLTQQLEHALTSRVVIEQAKGVLAERHGIEPEAAFRRLRTAARNSRRPLRTVAGEVVASTSQPRKEG